MVVCERMKGCCERWDKIRLFLAGIFLLIVRLYWGWGFFQSGLGKFNNFEKTLGFFTSLGLPAPALQVYLASATELVGGLLLMIGLGSRVVPIPLIFTMMVAYATAHHEELVGIFSNPDGFLSAPPFLFLMASLIVLFFGPGPYAADRWCCKNRC